MQVRVQVYREARRMKRAELARKIGVDRSFISRIEQGTRCPRGELMLKLARVFECKVEDLFCLD